MRDAGAACHRRHPFLATIARYADATEPVKVGPGASRRGKPRFAVSQFHSLDKTETYQILGIPRRPQGRLPLGRRQASRSPNSKSIAPAANRATRDPHRRLGRPNGRRAARTGGGRDHRQQVRPRDAASFDGGGWREPCLGFVEALRRTRFALSGWSCQGETLPARRAAISCMLSRLMLLRPEMTRNWPNYSPAPSSGGALLASPRPRYRPTG